MDYLRDKVAGGLRNMKYHPSMFIFTGDEENLVGEIDDIICGMPIIRTALTTHYLSDGATHFVPFICVWEPSGETYLSESDYIDEQNKFNDGYCNYEGFKGQK